MGNGSWSKWLQRGWGLYNVLSTIERNRRADDMARRNLVAEAKHHRAVEEYLSDPKPSGLLGDARLGTFEDARAAGLVTGGQGLFLGALHGATLSYNGPSHLLTYAKNRAGKGRDVILPCLAHVADRSVIVTCFKNGENTFASLEHRAQRLGQNVILLNPDRLLGLPNSGLNPLDVVIDAVARLDKPLEAAQEVAGMVIPVSGNERDPWVKQGAQELFMLVAIARAHEGAERCTLGELQQFGQRSDKEIIAELKQIGRGNAPSGVPGMARAKAEMIDAAKTQWEAHRSEYNNALLPFAPGESYTAATAKTETALSTLKEVPQTVYVMVDGRRLESAAKWTALVIHCLIEIVAQSKGDGRVLFLLDEFMQMPRIPAVTKALNLYAGMGIQLWPFVQDRAGLIAKYGKEFVNNLEQGSDVLQMWGIEDQEMLKRIEYISGRTTVATRGVTTPGGPVPTVSFGISEQSRPLLQAEDIRQLGPTKQLLRLPGYPLFIADRVPYYEIDDFGKLLRDPREVRRDTVLGVDPSRLEFL